MAAKSKALIAVPVKVLRAENKKERQDRRAEIMERWNRRVTKRIWDRERKDWRTVDDMVIALIHLGYWMPHIDLLEDEPADVLRELAARLARIIELKEMPYDEYLQTPEWTRLAAATKGRYNLQCALDASHPAEHAHHRTYERRGREYPSDLIPLCGDCHAKFHNKTPR